MESEERLSEDYSAQPAVRQFGYNFKFFDGLQNASSTRGFCESRTWTKTVGRGRHATPRDLSCQWNCLLL